MKYLKTFENISNKQFKKGDTVICVEDSFFDELDYDYSFDIKKGEEYVIVNKQKTPLLDIGIKVKHKNKDKVVYGYWPSDNFVYPEDYDTYINTQKYNL